MATQVKCLVKLNGEKFRVFIDDVISGGYKLAPKTRFRFVYKKIQQLNAKLDINFVNYKFELWDNDFSDYVVITDENQMIDDLSRFRVSQRKISDTDVSDKQTKQNKTNDSRVDSTTYMQSTSGHQISTNHKVCKKSLFSEKSTDDQKMNPKSKTYRKSPEKSLSLSQTRARDVSPIKQKSIPSLDMPSTSSSLTRTSSLVTPISLNIENNTTLDSLNRRIIDMLSIPLLSSEDVREFKDLKYVLDLNRELFEVNFESNGNWTKISNKMKQKGYNGPKYSGKNLKELFYKYEALYEQLLEYCSDERTATKYFALFPIFERMQLRSYLTSQSFQRLRLLREKFDLKVKSNTGSSIPSSSSVPSTPITPKVSSQQTVVRPQSETKLSNKIKTETTDTLKNRTIVSTPALNTGFSRDTQSAKKTFPRQPVFIPLQSAPPSNISTPRVSQFKKPLPTPTHEDKNPVVKKVKTEDPDPDVIVLD
ncbi:uncharacterized protein LOC128953640 [Oppia nitens]|uniref:uncharacterized protein LOC128953640 n=1 Tax=Oppia nitens TaxID=1686743 RepID=UPI0023DB1241|nr:uncharacterized protein LOC128953640 [Oppia nitens]